MDDDGVPGVMAAGVAGYYGIMVGEDVNNLAFAFVAPLRAYHHCGPALLHMNSLQDFAGVGLAKGARATSFGAHTPCRVQVVHCKLQGFGVQGVYMQSYQTAGRRSTANRSPPSVIRLSPETADSRGLIAEGAVHWQLTTAH